jgi:hypothetical protein
LKEGKKPGKKRKEWQKGRKRVRKRARKRATVNNPNDINNSIIPFGLFKIYNSEKLPAPLFVSPQHQEKVNPL